MNSFFLIHILGNHAPWIAMLFNIAGLVMVIKSMFTQDQQMQRQRLIITQLHEHVSECLKAQIASHDQVDSLNERCRKLLARQQLVEKRSPDSQRIELATRMLKRGTGDVQTLMDLGLSNSEIKLLTRLHSLPASVSAPPADKHRPVAAQGQALAQLLQHQAVVD